MKIILVNPFAEDTILKLAFSQVPFLKKCGLSTQSAPLALATVAALTPPEHEVSFHDEAVHGPVEPVLESDTYDIIGISFLSNQLPRTTEIARSCKERSLKACVVAGGPGTARPSPQLLNAVDVMFYGEAELTWPRFLEDLKKGTSSRHYEQISKPDLSRSPLPRWDLLKKDIGRYGSGAVQTTRGCPFDCAFCDVIYLNGRILRSKPVERVIEEVRVLENMGLGFVVFTDDNFAGNRKYAKSLLRELIKLNHSFKAPLAFVTQADLTIAQDDDLLELMAESNFALVTIGIESFSPESLKDLNKLHNTKPGPVEAVRKIQSYGIPVMATMMVGADSDTPGTFERTANWIREANITDHFMFLLYAPEGTKIWEQLSREKRLAEIPLQLRVRAGVFTNIIPKKMSRVELMEGLADYLDKVSDPRHYRERAIGFLQGVRPRRRAGKTRIRVSRRRRRIARSMFRYFLFQAPPEQRRCFVSVVMTTLRLAPSLLPRMLLLHTRFLLNHTRAKIVARLVREQAAYERAHPEALDILDTSQPVPAAIRDHVQTIIPTAYDRVRKKISNREGLYQAVLGALMDYRLRFGDSSGGFDAHRRDFLEERCDQNAVRVLRLPPLGQEDLAPGNPPAGFEREMLDALDRAVRRSAVAES